MDAFEVVRHIGQGAFGAVTEVRERSSGERFAVKVISNRTYDTWAECLKLREVRALRKLGSQHQHIVALRQVIRENKKLYLVFDYHPNTLHHRIRALRRENEALAPGERQQRFEMEQVGRWSCQLLSALAHMHRHGFFHRDIKPENLLLDAQGGIQVCDFGLARDVRSRPPYTDYVSTKWYRAPELVLRSTVYNSPVDIWAAACVIAEVLTLQPLFPAKDTVEHLLYIASQVEAISPTSWSAGYTLALKRGIQLPKARSCGSLDLLLLDRFGDQGDRRESVAARACVGLVCEMLRLDPQARLSASECLNHPFVRDFVSECAPPVTPRPSCQFGSTCTSAAGADADGGITPVAVDEDLEADAPMPSVTPRAGSPGELVRRSSALRILTKEIDDLAEEVAQIKTSPAHATETAARLVRSDHGQNVEAPGSPCSPLPSSPPPIPRPQVERTSSMERRLVITQYLDSLDDDDDDDEEDEDEDENEDKFAENTKRSAAIDGARIGGSVSSSAQDAAPNGQEKATANHTSRSSGSGENAHQLPTSNDHARGSVSTECKALHELPPSTGQDNELATPSPRSTWERQHDPDDSDEFDSISDGAEVEVVEEFDLGTTCESFEAVPPLAPATSSRSWVDPGEQERGNRHSPGDRHSPRSVTSVVTDEASSPIPAEEFEICSVGTEDDSAEHASSTEESKSGRPPLKAAGKHRSSQNTSHALLTHGQSSSSLAHEQQHCLMEGQGCPACAEELVTLRAVVKAQQETIRKLESRMA